MLAAARGRRHPVRWILPALGIALAAAFAMAVAAQSQIAGDQAARSVLDKASPLDSEVRITWQGPVSPSVADQARALLRGLGLGSPTEVVLMNPVRLSGVVVRPAAIAPLGGWLSGAAQARLGSLGPCQPDRCPMLLVGGGPVPSTLAAIGVRIQVAGSSSLRSEVPLGFVPSTADINGSTPVLVTGDVTGLESLAGLSGLYRTSNWLAPLTTTRLREWQLAGVEDRLARSQARLLLSGSRFSLSAPFTLLDEARAQASEGAAAPAARGRRSDHRAGDVHRPGRRWTSPRSAGRARSGLPRGCPHEASACCSSWWNRGGCAPPRWASARPRGSGPRRCWRGPRGNRLARLCCTA